MNALPNTSSATPAAVDLKTLSNRSAAAAALAAGAIKITTTPDGLRHICTADLDYVRALNGREDAGFWQASKGGKASMNVNALPLTDRSPLGIAECAVYAARATCSA